MKKGYSFLCHFDRSDEAVSHKLSGTYGLFVSRNILSCHMLKEKEWNGERNGEK